VFQTWRSIKHVPVALFPSKIVECLHPCLCGSVSFQNSREKKICLCCRLSFQNDTRYGCFFCALFLKHWNTLDMFFPPPPSQSFKKFFQCFSLSSRKERHICRCCVVLSPIQRTVELHHVVSPFGTKESAHSISLLPSSFSSSERRLFLVDVRKSVATIQCLPPFSKTHFKVADVCFFGIKESTMFACCALPSRRLKRGPLLVVFETCDTAVMSFSFTQSTV
jgi:hypothetical protein